MKKRVKILIVGLIVLALLAVLFLAIPSASAEVVEFDCYRYNHLPRNHAWCSFGCDLWGYDVAYSSPEFPDGSWDCCCGTIMEI